jgi:hypothetical protein
MPDKRKRRKSRTGRPGYGCQRRERGNGERNRFRNKKKKARQVTGTKIIRMIFAACHRDVMILKEVTGMS